jgi:acyl-CoA synthetase (AMP-forming)/AMP-acid ligase II
VTARRPLAEIEAQLLAPGAPFEVEETDVLGERLRVFKNRPRSLRDVVAGSRALGDATYLIFADGEREERFSFIEHARLVARCAARLRDEHGIARGDRVAILAANRPEWIVAFWATVSLGAIAVGLNAWWSEPEIRYALDDCAPKLLIADAKRLAVLRGDAGVKTVAMDGFLGTLCGGLLDPPLPDQPIAEDDPAVLLYTSGTTGRAKGAVHTHRNVIALVGMNFFHGARMAMMQPPAADAPSSCVLVTSPLFHVSGLHSAAIACLAGGVKSVWIRGRFEPEVALRLIAREKITGWGFTATLLHRIVNHPDAAKYDVSSIRHLGGGGSTIAPALQAKTRAIFPGARATLGVGYGLTECSALATLNPGDELAAYPESVGRAMPLVDIAIRDEAGAPIEDGGEGEIHVRSAGVMLEYWRNPAATAASILPGRWLRTGDIGRIEEGRLYLASRKRDLILRGGENVYPVEIEQRLEMHPAVAEAAVVGVEHDELGQEVMAIVVPADGARVDVEELRRWVGEGLAYYKVPAHWELRGEALPRNAVGKVMKHLLADATRPEARR